MVKALEVCEEGVATFKADRFGVARLEQGCWNATNLLNSYNFYIFLGRIRMSMGDKSLGPGPGHSLEATSPTEFLPRKLQKL
jgi:hypothetical protein